MSLVVEVARILDLAQLALRGVFPLLNLIRVLPLAGLVPGCRNFHVQSVMRALVVVEVTVLREDTLCLLLVCEVMACQTFPREGTVEALVLSLGLRVSYPSVENQDAEFHHPNFQLRKSHALDCSPRVSVITEERKREPVFLEQAPEHWLDTDEGLVQLCLAAKAEAAAIVENVQRMAPLLVPHGEMSFEIRLPHIVGLGLFKPLMRRCRSAGLGGDQVMPLENVVHGPGAGQVRNALVLHHRVHFRSTDGRILLTHSYDLRFHLRRHTVGMLLGRTALV